MSKCYNCGCEMESEDKSRLCDNCKKIMLPFLKLVDASTSSAVRRLIQNEQNLRNMGITDSGMEYMLKFCELHDKKKLREREEKENKKAADAAETIQNESNYSEMELPEDEPLNFVKKQYGTFLPAAEAVLAAAAAALLAVTVYKYAVDQNLDVTSLAGAIASCAGAYVSDCVRKTLHDFNEIKKKFK